ncbi:MAG: hypothetical protein ABJA61_05235, partial [Caldimonas sp.]
MPFDPNRCSRRAMLGAAASFVWPAASPATTCGAQTCDRAAFAPLLATVYAGQVDPALCLVSEKYDGV